MKVEVLVNTYILEALDIRVEEMPIDEAKNWVLWLYSEKSMVKQ